MEKRKQKFPFPISYFPSSNSYFPLVSIVVTTKNEEKHIANCLSSIKNSINPINPSNSINPTNPTMEIIVIDNNSSDNTVKIAKRFTDKIYNKGPERSAQRNYGVRKARGMYILYLDADMILSENVVNECVNKCEKDNIIALYIPERIVDNIKCLPRKMPKAISWGIKVRDFERSFYNATCIDAVRFVRRDKFLEIGEFDENLTGPEDWDFDRKIKKVGKVGIVKSSFLYHNEEEFNLKHYLKKKSYYSKNFKKYIQKWGKNDKIIKKQLGFWYRYFGVFVEDRKWKKLLRHPMLTLGMYILRFLVGLDYLLFVRQIGQER